MAVELDEASQQEFFAELVKKNQARIRSYVSSLGVTDASVDDVAQEAFLRAYERFSTFERDTSFYAWVSTIVRHLVWNDGRKSRRRFKIFNEKVTELLVARDTSELVAESEDSRLRHAALKDCLAGMTDEDRKLLVMRYYEDLNSTELAAQFDMAASSIRLRLMYLRDSLRDCICSKLNRKSKGGP